MDFLTAPGIKHSELGRSQTNRTRTTEESVYAGFIRLEATKEHAQNPRQKLVQILRHSHHSLLSVELL